MVKRRRVRSIQLADISGGVLSSFTPERLGPDGLPSPRFRTDQELYSDWRGVEEQMMGAEEMFQSNQSIIDNRRAPRADRALAREYNTEIGNDLYELNGQQYLNEFGMRLRGGEVPLRENEFAEELWDDAPQPDGIRDDRDRDAPREEDFLYTAQNDEQNPYPGGSYNQPSAPPDNNLVLAQDDESYRDGSSGDGSVGLA